MLGQPRGCEIFLGRGSILVGRVNVVDSWHPDLGELRVGFCRDVLDVLIAAVELVNDRLKLPTRLIPRVFEPGL